MKKIIAVVLVIVSIFSLATSAMAACTCSTSKPGVNVRKKANQSSSAVGNVAKGTSVSVLCTTTGTDLNKDGNKIWYYVQVLSCASGSKNNINGKYGYIHSSLDIVDNSQINVLTQRTMHRICTAATNEEVSFAYRVAIPRQRFRWRNAFSTRWRSL